MLASSFLGVRLYTLAETKQTKQDKPERKLKRIGKIHLPVFSPEGTQVVGFMVRLPEVAGMIKRADRFVARDALGLEGDEVVAKRAQDAFDKRAAKRLGINLDTCLMWTGMDVVSASGTRVGYCQDAEFDFKTGKVTAFMLTEGSTSNALIGYRNMPASMLRGYKDGAMVVADDVLSLEFSGGAAAKAAEAGVQVAAKASEVTAKAKVAVQKGATAFDKGASQALDKGSRALGKQLGKSKGMFSAFMSEYKKASKSDR